jgi:DNA-binding transcriptional LysR family regulator
VRSEWDLAKYVESGRPSVVLRGTRTAFCRSPSADLFMYYSNRRNQSARAHSFIDFLIGCFSDAR